MTERPPLPPLPGDHDGPGGPDYVVPVVTDVRRIQAERDLFESATGAAVHIEEIMRAAEEGIGDGTMFPGMDDLEAMYANLLGMVSEQALRVYRLGHGICPPE